MSSNREATGIDASLPSGANEEAPACGGKCYYAFHWYLLIVVISSYFYQQEEAAKRQCGQVTVFRLLPIPTTAALAEKRRELNHSLEWLRCVARDM